MVENIHSAIGYAEKISQFVYYVQYNIVVVTRVDFNAVQSLCSVVLHCVPFNIFVDLRGLEH